MSLVVVPGPASIELGENVAKQLSAEVLTAEAKIFPDGESKIRFGKEVYKENVVIVQSTYPPVDRHLIQLIFMMHWLSKRECSIILVIPYFGYSRQDREFLKGEVISLQALAKLFSNYPVKHMITADFHNISALGYFSFPSYSISAIPLIANYIKRSYKLRDPICISPDFGGSARAEALANLLSIQCMVLRKERDRVTGEVKVAEKDMKVAGKDVIVIDDIISTGASIAKAARLLKRNGARKVIAACTHALLVNDALKKMAEYGVDEAVATNCVPSPISKIDLSPLIASHLRSL
jgi:ribose-phosphate pyrophosphokinase